MNIEDYAKNCVNNIAKPEKKETINLILDGGAFNGSYLIGAMYFLMEMEKKNYIAIDKISCSSVGSLIALGYISNTLALFSGILYENMRRQFKQECNLNIFDKTFEQLKPLLPKDIYKKMSGRVFISYYNIQTGQKVIKSKFKSTKDVLETIRRSCSVPFIVDGTFAYKNRFVDGFNPYIFPSAKDRRILYLDLCGYDKIIYILNIKNEVNNTSRVFTGLLDIYIFFLKGHSTSMCSFVDKWALMHHIHYTGKLCLELIIYYLLIFIKPIMAFSYYSPPALQLVKRVYNMIIQKYCV